MSEIICFGEMMLRLTPEVGITLRQAKRLDMIYGGAEANVAVALSGFGRDTAMVTTLPEQPLGEACRGMLAAMGVDTRFVQMRPGRMGMYFMEKGSSLRPSQIWYDRAGSAFALADPESYRWETVFEGAAWFHCTGITPALSEGNRRALLNAAQTARSRGVKVACDINFRRNLWTGKEAGAYMTQLLPLCDWVITNADQVEDVLGWRERDDLTLARRLCDTWSLEAVAMTGRESRSADDNVLTGALYLASEDAWYTSSAYRVHPVVDRIGGGDAFAAGLIYGAREAMPPQQMIEFAVAADAYKHTLTGDAMSVPAEAIWTIAQGDRQGRVKR